MRTLSNPNAKEVAQVEKVANPCKIQAYPKITEGKLSVSWPKENGEGKERRQTPQIRMIVTNAAYHVEAALDENEIFGEPFTMRGVTNSIEFPANIEVTETGVNFTAPTFGIDRTKWGVKFHDREDASIAESLKEDLIDHTIELNFVVTANA